MKLIIKIIFLCLVVIGILGGIYLFSQYLEYREFRESGKWEEKLNIAKGKANYAKYEELPSRYIDAVLSVEDKRFFEHSGIDLKSIGRAIYNNFRRKKLAEGGSTITQQLAKNIFFTQDASIARKVNEMYAAIDLEKEFSKEEILELYVNNSYFGSGYYTIKDAAKGYFGKTLDELNLNEITFLAGVPNAPSIYDPRKNPDLAKQRQIQVLNKMRENDKLTEEEQKQIEKLEIKVKK